MSEDVRSERSPLGVDIALGLGASWFWAVLFTKITFGVQSVAFAWGMAAMFFTPFIVLLRRSRPFSPTFAAVLHGAIIGVGPFAAVAAVLLEKTHHRALGAVTFAAVACVIGLFSVLLAWRLSSPKSGGAWRRRVRIFLSTLSLGLVLGALALLSHRLPPGVSLSAIAGVLLGSAAAAAPRWGARGWVLGLALLLWIGVVSHAARTKTMHRGVDERRIGF